MFGRKKLAPAGPSVALAAAADHLAQVALRNVQTEDGGVRVEDYLTVLAATVGEAVLVSAGLLDIGNDGGARPPDAGDAPAGRVRDAGQRRPRRHHRARRAGPALGSLRPGSVRGDASGCGRDRHAAASTLVLEIVFAMAKTVPMSADKLG